MTACFNVEVPDSNRFPFSIFLLPLFGNHQTDSFLDSENSIYFSLPVQNCTGGSVFPKDVMLNSLRDSIEAQMRIIARLSFCPF